MSSPFTLTIDWLAFTIPVGSVEETMDVLGGDWTKSEVGFRGYPMSWITAGAGRGVGKLGTVRSVPPAKCMSICQPGLSPRGHSTRSAPSCNGS